MTNEEVLSELHSIKKILAGARFGKDELWTPQDIADYLSLTKAYVQRTIIKSKSFPQPFELEGTKTLRWRACEVMQYAAKHRVSVAN